MRGHVVPITVRFDDLDPWGHVNHARYLGYFEAARVQLLDDIGFGILDMARTGRQIILAELTARYLRPSGLHDLLEISTTVTSIGRAVATWRQEARRGDDLVATLDIRSAFTDLDGRPARPPEGFVEAIADFVAEG